MTEATQALKFTEVGELGVESQGIFAPETLPDDAEVYSRRWKSQRSDGLWVVITYWCAPALVDLNKDADDEANQQGFDLQDATEFTICEDGDDPWSTEVDTDYVYDNPNYMLIDTIERANASAKHFVRNFDVDLFIHVKDTDDRQVKL